MTFQSDFDNKIFQIYKSLYQYKDLLKGAPVLDVDPSVLSDETYTIVMPKINEQTQRMVGYLLGIRQTDLTISRMAPAIEKYYQKDDFWRRLLIAYAEAIHEKDTALLTQEKKKVQEQAKTLLNKVTLYKQKRKEIVASFAAAVEKEKFRVNAKKLFTNYLNMAEANPEQAWTIMITNPAYFSAILTKDADGKVVLNPTQAALENQRLASFVKRLKA